MRLLKAEEIDVKVKQVNGNGCLLLLYKTARVDMQILDEVFMPMGWQCEYKDINGVLYCGIGVKDTVDGGWVWKWDCGIESRDNEGNEKKGEASDAFKRAGFKWGIGRELYTAPFIWAKVPTVAQKDKNGKEFWVLAEKYERFSVKEITYDKAGNISELVIVDSKDKVVYSNTPTIRPATFQRKEVKPTKKAAFIDPKHLSMLNTAQNMDELDDSMAQIKSSYGDSWQDVRAMYVPLYKKREKELSK